MMHCKNNYKTFRQSIAVGVWPDGTAMAYRHDQNRSNCLMQRLDLVQFNSSEFRNVGAARLLAMQYTARVGIKGQSFLLVMLVICSLYLVC